MEEQRVPSGFRCRRRFKENSKILGDLFRKLNPTTPVNSEADIPPEVPHELRPQSSAHRVSSTCIHHSRKPTMLIIPCKSGSLPGRIYLILATESSWPAWSGTWSILHGTTWSLRSALASMSMTPGADCPLGDWVECDADVK